GTCTILPHVGKEGESVARRGAESRCPSFQNELVVGEQTPKKGAHDRVLVLLSHERHREREGESAGRVLPRGFVLERKPSRLALLHDADSPVADERDELARHRRFRARSTTASMSATSAARSSFCPSTESFTPSTSSVRSTSPTAALGLPCSISMIHWRLTP